MRLGNGTADCGGPGGQRDNRFTVGLSHYRQRYMDYFSMHCNWIIAEQQGEQYSLRRMIPETKQILARMQNRLLRMPMRVEDKRPVNWKFWH